jgi:DNA-binding NarL/FixJ family response regulator
VIVKDIEEKVNNLNRIYKNANISIEQRSTRAMEVEQEVPHKMMEEQPNQIVLERTIVPVKYKPMTITPIKRNTPKEEPQKSKQEVIYDLFGQGISIVDIAKKMNIGQGEVSLILSLKKEEN